MSTYINEHQNILPTFDEAPDFVRRFVQNFRGQKNRSYNTIKSYYVDIRSFGRYLLKIQNRPEYKGKVLDELPWELYPENLLCATQEDIESFLFFCSMDLGNDSRTRSRKLSALKAFYSYLYRQGMIDENPAKEAEGPDKHAKKDPIYLTYEQCLVLLDNIQTESPARDYCIITLLLNCGLRLSELINIDFDDLNMSEGYIKVTGKGNKERKAYLNEACVAALAEYFFERNSKYRNIIDSKALFVSWRTGKRLTARAVELMVQKRLAAAGLSGKHFSPHKFRHTAATLMHKGGTDLLTIKDVLGHSSTKVTEIYTHLENEELAAAVASTPLATVIRDE